MQQLQQQMGEGAAHLALLQQQIQQEEARLELLRQQQAAMEQQQQQQPQQQQYPQEQPNPAMATPQQCVTPGSIASPYFSAAEQLTPAPAAAALHSTPMPWHMQDAAWQPAAAASGSSSSHSWKNVESLGVKFSGERSPLALTAGAWAQQWLEHASLWVHSIGSARLAGAALPELDGRRLVSVAANSLQGAAATWYRQQRATTWAGAVPAWEAFVDALQQQFPDPHPLLTLQAVTNLKQSGTVEAYLQYATKVDGQTPDVPRLHKVKCFLNGLRDSQLQHKGLQKFLKHPEWQLADAIKWVSQEAMAAQLVANQQKPSRSHGGAINALLGQQPGSSHFSGCYACGSADHRVRDYTDAAKKEQWLAKQKKQRRKQQQGEGSRPLAGGDS